MIDLSIVLDTEIDKLDKRIKDVAKERDESATPTESTHDQTRQVANQLFNSFLEDRGRLLSLRNVVKKYKKIYLLKNDTDGEEKQIMIVPDGLGGSKVDGVLLVGEKSPLGMAVTQKNADGRISINEKEFTISEI